MAFSFERQAVRKPDAEGDGSQDRKVESSQSQYLQYLRENGLENLATLDLTLILGPHSSSEDADDSLKHVQGAEILLVEAPGHAPEFEKEANSFIAGQSMSLPKDFHDRFGAQILRSLREKGTVPMATADVPLTSRVGDASVRMFKQFVQTIRVAAERHLERKVAKALFLERATKFAQTIPRRERYIAAQIGPAIIRALAAGQKRSEVTTLAVAVMMGGSHRELGKLLTERHPSTSIIADQTDAPYTDLLESVLAKGEQASDDFLDNAFTEDTIKSIIGDKLRTLMPRFTDQATFLRKCVDGMHFSKREELHQFISRNDPPGAASFLEKYLGEIFPETDPSAG